MPTGITFNLRRFSTEDGPGIRTTVFMKGCPCAASGATIRRGSLLSQPKYRRLSQPYPLEGAELPTRAKMERLQAVALGGGVGVAVWSGAVRD